MNWINVKDKLPNNNQEVHFMSQASYGKTVFVDGDFEYNRTTDEFVSVAGMGTPDHVKKWSAIMEDVDEKN